MPLDKPVRGKMWRLLLRYIPFVPGPELIDLIAQISRSQKDVDAQVNEALESIQRTAEVVHTLEASLKDRASKLEALRKQHEHLSQLTSIEAEKAAALLRQVEETVGKHQVREHIVGFAIHLIAGLVLFALGVFFSDWFKGLLKAVAARFAS